MYPQDTKPATPPAEPRCEECGCAEMVYCWHEFANGTRHVRRSCASCGKWNGFAPRQPPFTEAADQQRFDTAALDALILAEQEGIELVSDSRGIFLRPWNKASERLKRAVRQQQHLLASLLGNTARRN